MTTTDQMKLFFEPKSVAILGVSRKTGSGSFNIVECLQLYGYQGKVYPVNPNAQEILNIRCHPSVEDIREPIDLAVISLDRNQVLPAVESCVNAGIKAIVVISQGLADVGKEGKVLQNKIRDAARAKGARIVGPNTMGVVNNFHNFTTSSIPLVKTHSSVSIICQSGIFITGFYSFTGPIGKAIDIGNTCDVDFADVLEYYASDLETQIIEAATRFPTKPIVVWAYGPDLERITEKLDASGRVVILPSAERSIQVFHVLLGRWKFLEQNENLS